MEALNKQQQGKRLTKNSFASIKAKVELLAFNKQQQASPDVNSMFNNIVAILPVLCLKMLQIYTIKAVAALKQMRY